MYSTGEHIVEEAAKTVLDAAGLEQMETELESSPLLFVLHRESADFFALAVVNTGMGAEYNPMCPDPINSSGLHRSASFILREIPVDRATNATFWFLATRMLVYPSKFHSSKMLYEHLLPYLNRKPLLANTLGPGMIMPRGGDPSRVNLVLGALQHILMFAGRKNTCHFSLEH